MFLVQLFSGVCAEAKAHGNVERVHEGEDSAQTWVSRRDAFRVSGTPWSPPPATNLKSRFLHGNSWQIGHQVFPNFCQTDQRKSRTRIQCEERGQDCSWIEEFCSIHESFQAMRAVRRKPTTCSIHESFSGDVCSTQKTYHKSKNAAFPVTLTFQLLLPI